MKQMFHFMIVVIVLIFLVGCGVVESPNSSGNSINRNVYPVGTLPPNSVQSATVIATLDVIDPNITPTLYVPIQDETELIVDLGAITRTPTLTITIGSSVKFVDPPWYTAEPYWNIDVDQEFLSLTSPFDPNDVTTRVWQAQQVGTVEMYLKNDVPCDPQKPCTPGYRATITFDIQK